MKSLRLMPKIPTITAKYPPSTRDKTRQGEGIMQGLSKILRSLPMFPNQNHSRYTAYLTRVFNRSCFALWSTFVAEYSSMGGLVTTK